MSQTIDLKVEHTNKLAQENEVLRAQVEQLREAMENLMAFQVKNLDVWNNLPYDICYDLLKSTPAQCLQEIKAQAVEEFIILFQEHYPIFCTERPFHRPVKMLTACKDIYANKLRQAAKGE